MFIETIRSSDYPLVCFERGLLERLRSNLSGLPVCYPDGFLLQSTIEISTKIINEHLGAEFAGKIAALRTVDANAPGFCVLRFGADICNWDEDDLSRVLLSFCALIGTPFRVFDRWPIWKPLGVSFEVGPSRATGIGHNPLHIDVVNSTHPPDYVAFFCDRVDPAGGGHSIFSNLLKAWLSLSPHSLQVLSDPHFREGAFYDLTGVGAEYNPFPIIDVSFNPPRIRFTAKMRSDLSSIEDQEAFDEFFDALTRGQTILLLESGDLVLVNQWVAAHGRLPLGEGQRDLPLDRRRLIRQCFISEQVRA